MAFIIAGLIYQMEEIIMSKPPDKIYLQWYGNDETAEEPFDTGCGITWCVDKINDSDPEYALLPILSREQIVAKFKKSKGGYFIYQEDPIEIRIWAYWPQDTPGTVKFEYVLHYGKSTVSTGLFSSMEDAATDAWATAVAYLEQSLRDMRS